MKFNTFAVTLWIFGASTGAAVYGVQGAALGLAATTGLSLLASLAGGHRR